MWDVKDSMMTKKFGVSETKGMVLARVHTDRGMGREELVEGGVWNQELL